MSRAQSVAGGGLERVYGCLVIVLSRRLLVLVVIQVLIVSEENSNGACSRVAMFGYESWLKLMLM
jgi:hypothetical protein